MGPQHQLSDFVGEYGPYQLFITVFLFLRYVILGLMANSGPLMTPDVTFYCQLPMEEIVAMMPNITLLNATEQEVEIREEFKRICQIDLHLYQQAYYSNGTINQYNRSTTAKETLLNSGTVSTTATATSIANQFKLPRGFSVNSTNRIRECSDFTYDIAPDQGRTMTSEFDLVCDRDWFRSLFQSLLSAAIVVAHVFWGTFSDKYGRFKAQKLCLLVSLIAGCLSIFAIDFWTFTFARAICSFGDLGLVVSLTTTVVELVGNQYRGLSVAIVNFGYALGVTILPYIVAYFEDFRAVILCTVLCHLISMPFILTTNESVRWLLTNRKFNSAKKELKRIARWNKNSLLATCFVWPIEAALIINSDDQPKQQQHESTQDETIDNIRTSKKNCWPHVRTKKQQVAGTSESDGSRDSKKGRKKAEEELAFDLLFSKFVEQIESQNFCDPLGGQSETSLSRKTSPATPANSGQNSTPLLETKSLAISTSNHNQDYLVQNGRLSVSSCLLDIKSQPAEAVTVMRRQPISIGTWLKLARSGSCNQLQELNHNQSVKFLSGDNRSRAVPNRTRKSSAIDESFAVPTTFSRSQRPSLASESSQAIELTLIKEYQVEADICPSESGSIIDCEMDQQMRQTVATATAAEASLVRHKPTQQPDCIMQCNLVAHQLSFVGRVNRLFRDKKLMIAVFTIVWTTFNSELQYTSFIIINLEVGEDVYLNYILGGCMEALAAISASILLSYAPRRQSLITFWLLISISCCGLSIAHIDSTWAVWLLALAKFSQSCLSSIASVAAYESFPTFLRQSGSGLVFTLGMLGSVFAPLIFAEFDDHAGMDRVLMTFSISSLTAATLIYLFLKETRNCELQ